MNKEKQSVILKFRVEPKVDIAFRKILETRQFKSMEVEELYNEEYKSGYAEGFQEASLLNNDKEGKRF